MCISHSVTLSVTLSMTIFHEAMCISHSETLSVTPSVTLSVSFFSHHHIHKTFHVTFYVARNRHYSTKISSLWWILCLNITRSIAMHINGLSIIVIERIDSYAIVEGHSVHAAMICGFVWMKKCGVMLTTVGLSPCRFSTTSLIIINSLRRSAMYFLIGSTSRGDLLRMYNKLESS